MVRDTRGMNCFKGPPGNLSTGLGSREHFVHCDEYGIFELMLDRGLKQSLCERIVGKLAHELLFKSPGAQKQTENNPLGKIPKTILNKTFDVLSGNQMMIKVLCPGY